jgi:hypothetical protein
MTERKRLDPILQPLEVRRVWEHYKRAQHEKRVREEEERARRSAWVDPIVGMMIEDYLADPDGSTEPR